MENYAEFRFPGKNILSNSLLENLHRYIFN